LPFSFFFFCFVFIDLLETRGKSKRSRWLKPRGNSEEHESLSHVVEGKLERRRKMKMKRNKKGKRKKKKKKRKKKKEDEKSERRWKKYSSAQFKAALGELTDHCFANIFNSMSMTWISKFLQPSKLSSPWSNLSQSFKLQQPSDT